ALEHHQEKRAELAFFAVSGMEIIFLAEAGKEFLGEVLRVFGAAAEAPDVEINRIPVGLTNRSAGGVGLGRIGRAGLADGEPVRVFEGSGFVEGFEIAFRIWHKLPLSKRNRQGETSFKKPNSRGASQVLCLPDPHVFPPALFPNGSPNAF